ncbi:unnamed protein product [Bursaphelenchus xylophilus]|uniref:(pine wood nematode) hypothetical protein n=1 Tax=Bursaphelenchus xylophilus TaxID=6326 RepID=A0A7I8XDY6_BURXY|nr:unnamed protein product [Bursaphelenchus xylophilus]CAG9113939.1 unnamed protein product [Bursaphelenchus xylophilus]
MVDTHFNPNVDSTFKQIYDCVLDFYSGQCDPSQPEDCIDVKKNINENFADLFGTRMAYFAYKRAAASERVTKRPKSKVLEKFTDDQLFFINLAQTISRFLPKWASHLTPEAVHSPAKVRAWGSIAGLRAFSNAFNCSAGTSVVAENVEDKILREKARFMEMGMDDTADPCEDFWRYANGRRNATLYEINKFLEARRILLMVNPKYNGTAMQTVKNEYLRCVYNPQLYLPKIAASQAQIAEIEEFDAKTRDSLASKDVETYLSVFTEGCRLLFKYGSEAVFHRMTSYILGDGRLYLPSLKITEEFEIEFNTSAVPFPYVELKANFLSDIFGVRFEINDLPVFLILPQDNQTDVRQAILTRLSTELWKTITVPRFMDCESFLRVSFPAYYAKMVYDYWGAENIKKADQKYLEDLSLLVDTVNTTFRFSNALSENMTAVLQKRIDANRFFGVAHPIFEDEEFFKHFSDVVLELPYQNRWLNKYRPLLQAASGHNYTYLAVPEFFFNAFHTPLTQLTVINLPILQPLYFHPTFSPLLRFSGTGFVVGHEFGHDFDKNIEDPAYSQIFDCLYQYYNHQCDPADPNSCIDPVHDQSEEFADVFGAQMAYLTYKREVEVRGVGRRPQGNLLDRLSDDKIFFINLAQGLMEFPKWGDLDFTTDTHPPAQTRLWGALAGLPAFSNAFNCPKRSKFNQEGCILYNEKIQPDYNLTDISNQ